MFLEKMRKQLSESESQRKHFEDELKRQRESYARLLKESTRKKEGKVDVSEQVEKLTLDNADKEEIIKELSTKLAQAGLDLDGLKREVQELRRKAANSAASAKTTGPVQVDNKVMEQLQVMAEKLQDYQEREAKLLGELRQKDETIKKKEEGIAELKSRLVALAEASKKKGKK